jgi:Glycosyltransferase family 87
MSNLRTAAAIVMVGLFLVYGTIFYHLRRQLSQGYSDFVIFYTAGKILHRGAADRLYDIRLQYEIQQEFAPNVEIRKGALPFVRPPWEAWLFWPLAYLPYGTAFILWNLFSAGCLLAVAAILRREVPELCRFSPGLMLASMFSYFPVFVTILQGQDSILLLLIYVVAYRELRRNAQFASGMLLGFGTLKFPLVLPFLIPFVVKRRLHVVSGFMLTSLLLAGVSVATVGVSTAAYYPRFLLNIDQLAKGANVPKDMPNIRGLLSVLLQSKLSSAAGVVLLSILSVLLLAFVIRKWWCLDPANRSANLILGFSLNIVVTLLVSYHCHSFDLCLLLLPIGLVLGLLLSNEQITPKTRTLLIWTLGVVGFSPLYLLLSFTLNYPGLLSLLLLTFMFAIGAAISDLQGRSIPGSVPASMGDT